MKSRFLVVCSFLALCFLASCSATEEIETIPVEERYVRAKAFFDDEDYLKAIDEFKIITVQFQGSEYGDDAQFYMAQSRFLRGEYILAAAEFDNLVRIMPNSPFATIARYQQGESYYRLSPRPQLDQKYTRYALDQFQAYIDYAPKDSMVADAETKINELTLKLSQKMFENGRLYYRLEYYRAAISYFDKLIQEYHDSPFVDDGIYWKAQCQNERKDFTGALQTLDGLIAKFPTTDLQEDITWLKKKIADDKNDFEEEQREKALNTIQ